MEEMTKKSVNDKKSLEKTEKAPAKRSKPMPPKPMIDWAKAGQSIEEEMRERGWSSRKQRRNPRYVMGLISRHLVRPLIEAIHKSEVDKNEG